MGLFNGQVFQETRIEGLLEESKAQVQSSGGLQWFVGSTWWSREGGIENGS